MGVGKLAFQMFGRLFRGKEHSKLKDNLRKARMTASPEIYKASSLFYSIFVGVAGGVAGLLVGILLGLPSPLSIAPVLMLGILFSALSYQLFLSYPGMAAGERARKIDAAVPYAASYMYALSRSGMNVADIFKDMSRRPDLGEISTEAKVFLRDLEYLGEDPLTSLRNLSRSTPSERFSNFLEVLVSIIETGGDVTAYFKTRTDEYHDLMEDAQEETITTLEFMSEIYVILIAFAPLLFLTLLIFMQFLQPVSDMVLMVIAYVWIPLGSIAFAVMIATQSREQIGANPPKFNPPQPYKDVPTSGGSEYDKKIISQVRSGGGKARLKAILTSPFKAITRQPAYVLVLSIPLALIYLFFISSVINTSALVWTFVISAVPYSIAYEYRARIIGKTKEALPDLLKSLESASSSGLTLSRSIAISSTADLGPLTDEVKRAHKDIEWGASANEALADMEYRVRNSATAARAITLVRKASEAEADVSDVIDIVEDDVETERSLERNRTGAMFVYKLIILITFAVFLVTVYFMVDSFMAIPAGTIGGQQAAGLQLGGIDVSFLKQLFYHVLILQGLFAGLIASQMGEGDLRFGIKYSLVMVLIAWAIFEFVLLPMQPRVVGGGEEEAIMTLLGLA